MGFRIRKSIQIVPGVRMNVSRSQADWLLGRRQRCPRHQACQRPGEQNRVDPRHRDLPPADAASIDLDTATPSRTTIVDQKRSSRIRTPTPADVAPEARETRVLAPARGKDLFALLQSRQPNDFMAVARKHGRSTPHARLLAAILEGLLHVELGRGNPQAQERARFLLGWSAAQDATRPLLDFVLKYLPDRDMAGRDHARRHRTAADRRRCRAPRGRRTSPVCRRSSRCHLERRTGPPDHPRSAVPR